MLKIERAIAAVAIAAAISLPLMSVAQAASGLKKPASDQRIYNSVQDPATAGGRATSATKLVTPGPLDPAYHGVYKDGAGG